jgi:hypothetical protein
MPLHALGYYNRLCYCFLVDPVYLISEGHLKAARQHRLCFSALPYIHCKPCVPRSVRLKLLLCGLLPNAHDQRMLVPVCSLWRMLFGSACQGHVQQCPGSDLPHLRAGVVQWLTSPGIPVMEDVKVTSHLA